MIDNHIYKKGHVVERKFLVSLIWRSSLSFFFQKKEKKLIYNFPFIALISNCNMCQRNKKREEKKKSHDDDAEKAAAKKIKIKHQNCQKKRMNELRLYIYKMTVSTC